LIHDFSSGCLWQHNYPPTPGGFWLFAKTAMAGTRLTGECFRRFILYPKETKEKFHRIMSFTII